MINRLEMELGYPVVERRQGGKQGGNTTLTDRGMAFLIAYQKYEEEVLYFTQSSFHKLLIETKII